MVVVENFEVYELFVLFKMERKKVFGDVLVRKQAFLDNNNMDFKKREIGIFPKGIIHEFGQKVDGFSSFVFIKK